VYLVLLQRTRIEHRNPVVLTTARLKQYGISRKDKCLALPALEKAGLIRVKRRGRSNPLVRLLKGEAGS
jgi:hypothetical protein